MRFMKHLSIGLSVCSLLTLTACSDSDSDSKDRITQSFELTVSNLTSNQPFSPLAVALHDESYSAWSIGEASSEGLEHLAESGASTIFLTEAIDSDAFSTEVGSGLIVPGQSETLMLESMPSNNLKLTIATMLVNTNDAFIGKNSLAINNLEVDESITVYLPVYDAGTEGNNELAGTIPGPADGGEGYNALRDDVNIVSRHPGVVTQEEGYADSILDSSHRFDSPAAKLVIKRTM